MASEVGIANSALRKVGAKVIVSFTDGTPSANFISDRYATARDELLRLHPWNFATKRAELARSSDVPAFEFSYFYTLPTDWIRTLNAFDSDAGTGSLNFKEESGTIAANSEDVFLHYVYKVTDPNVMTSDFREALSCLLAMDAATSLASSNALYDRMEKAFETRLMTAKSTDAMANRGGPFPKGTWVTRRSRSQSGWPV